MNVVAFRSHVAIGANNVSSFFCRRLNHLSRAATRRPSPPSSSSCGRILFNQLQKTVSILKDNNMSLYSRHAATSLSLLSPCIIRPKKQLSLSSLPLILSPCQHTHHTHHKHKHVHPQRNFHHVTSISWHNRVMMYPNNNNKNHHLHYIPFKPLSSRRRRRMQASTLVSLYHPIINDNFHLNLNYYHCSFHARRTTITIGDNAPPSIRYYSSSSSSNARENNNNSDASSESSTTSSSKKKSSSDNNNNNNNTPKFQDTEVPWYSFFDGFDDKSNITSNSTSSANFTQQQQKQQQQQQQQLQPPPMSKVLSILVPESKSLLIALGALTISTVATLQFPNAIGQMIDLLSVASTAGSVGGMDVGMDVGMMGCEDGTSSITENSTPQTTQSITPQEQHQQMKSIAFQMSIYFTIGSITTFVHSSMFDSIGQKIGARLRKELFTKLMNEEVSFFDQNRAGELANRLSTDVHEVAEHLVQNIAYFLSNFVRSITSIVQMMMLSPLLTLYLCPLPFVLGGFAMFYGKFIKLWSKKHLDVLAHSTHIATERFGGISTVLSFGQRRAEHARYSGVIEAAYGFAKRVAIFQGAFLGSSYMVGNGALLGVLVVGAFQVLDGGMTPGNLAGFCMYAGHLADSVLELSEATGGFLRAQGSGARLFALLDREQQQQQQPLLSFDQNETQSPIILSHDEQSSLPIVPTILPPMYNPTVRFENVGFAYPTHPDTKILNEVSFTLSNGEMLAITGSSGSGKSSIISLLMRFYEPMSGRITLDGTDIRSLDTDWLRFQIGLVGQEPILFHASVFDNVAYGMPEATREDVIEACVAANAHRFILDLPDQYETIVGERGASVSGGEKQRLCIARALLTKPRILALDEASSALDAPNEQDFLQLLRRLLESKDNDLSAVVFITHKRTVLQACDRVAVLSNGRITEKGLYDVLDKAKGDQLRKLMMGESSKLE